MDTVFPGPHAAIGAIDATGRFAVSDAVGLWRGWTRAGPVMCEQVLSFDPDRNATEFLSGESIGSDSSVEVLVRLVSALPEGLIE